MATSPCCIISGKDDMNVSDTVDFQNDPQLTHLREEFDHKRQPPQCHECAIRKDLSLRASTLSEFRREGWLQDPTRVELVKLQYNCEPICNAKCVMCGPWYSSTWAQENHRFDKKAPRERTHKDFKHNDSIRDLDLGDLRHLYFNGGEPLMTKEHVTVMEKVPDISKVMIEYNTNGSVWPSAEVWQLWRRARTVTLNVSVDGMGDQFEYIRNPLRWKDVDGNTREFVKQGIHVRCAYTYGLYNVLQVKETREWFESFSNQGFHINPVIKPEMLSVANASPQLKQRFIDYCGDDPGLREIVNICKDNRDKSATGDWKDWFDRLDSRRGTNWREVFDQLA